MESSKPNLWRLCRGPGKISAIIVGIWRSAVLAAPLYINGKLDLLRYNDGSVSGNG